MDTLWRGSIVDGLEGGEVGAEKKRRVWGAEGEEEEGNNGGDA